MNTTAKSIVLSVGISTAVTVSLFQVMSVRLMNQSLQASTQLSSTGGIIPAITYTESTPITDVVKQAEPAVVSVIISKDLPIMERYYEDQPADPFFGFNLRIPRIRQNGTERREVGGGTAFFVSSDGLLMTNKHVVSDKDADYTVLLNDGRKLDAEVVGMDSLNDIALLKVKETGFPALKFSTQTEPLLGQSVIAIGNSLGEFRNTVSVGVVSGLERSIVAGSPSQGTAEQLNRIIQTDAAINEGNSGGPLLDLHGEVIGMNTAIAASAQNISFAIPIVDLQRVLESYQKYGRIVRPYLGIRYTQITPELKMKNNLSYDYGVIVERGDTANDLAVIPGSPAAKAGLQEGDIILEADAEKITQTNMLGDIIQRKHPGDQIELSIDRNGKKMTIKATLDEWKE